YIGAAIEMAGGNVAPMKKRILWKWMLGLVLALASTRGVAQQDQLKPSAALAPNETRAAPAATNLLAPAINPPLKLPSPLITSVAETSDRYEMQPPPGTYVSSWLNDIVKLGQREVEYGILLTYIDSA